MQITFMLLLVVVRLFNRAPGAGPQNAGSRQTMLTYGQSYEFFRSGTAPSDRGAA